MNGNKMMSAINTIDDKYLDEAINYKAKKVISFRNWKVIGALAASIGLVIGVSAYQYNYNYGVDSIVGIDVNPSIELEVSKSEKVVGVEALNEDAELVLDGLELEGMDLDNVVDDIMDSMVENGYLDDISYSVNVCVENKDVERGDELGNKVSEKITTILDEKDMIGTVNSQSCEINDELVEKAKECGVSVGKYLLAQKVTEATGMTKEEAVKLSVSELFDLSDAEQLKLITKDEAIEIVCNDAGVDKEAVKVVESKIKYLGETYVFSVKFIADESMCYKYVIDATTGDILQSSSEEKTEDAVKPEVNKPEKETDSKTDSEAGAETEKSETEQVKLISKRELLEIICKDTGANKKQVRLDELKVEGTETITYYVELYVGKTYYQYVINAVDGTIIDNVVEEPEADTEIDTEIDTEMEVKPGVEGNEQQKPEQNQKPELDNQQKPEEDKKDDVTTEQTYITKDEAVNVALEDAGVTKDTVSLLKVSFKNNRKDATYSISFYVEKTLYTYNVSATTGEIVEKRDVAIPETNVQPEQNNKPSQNEKPSQGEVETPEMPEKPSQGEKERPEMPSQGEMENPEMPEQNEIAGRPQMGVRTQRGQRPGAETETLPEVDQEYTAM